jgi:hypothetical protein
MKKLREDGSIFSMKKYLTFALTVEELFIALKAVRPTQKQLNNGEGAAEGRTKESKKASSTISTLDVDD